MRFTVVVSSVGGQGGLTLSRIIARAAAEADYKVVVGETLGMSQRFGSVQSYVRFGDAVYSPLPLEPADLILGLEPLEALRAAALADRRTTVLTSAEPVDTQTTQVGLEKYPSLEWIVGELQRRAGKVLLIRPFEASRRRFGTGIQANMILLGASASLQLLPLSLELLEDAVRAVLGERSSQAIQALWLGFNGAENLVREPGRAKNNL